MVKKIVAVTLLLAGCQANEPCATAQRENPGGQVLEGEGLPSRGVELADGLYVPPDQRRATGVADVTYCVIEP